MLGILGPNSKRYGERKGSAGVESVRHKKNSGTSSFVVVNCIASVREAKTTGERGTHFSNTTWSSYGDSGRLGGDIRFGIHVTGL